MNDKCPNALSMLGELELKNDDWVKAKETFRAASDATDGKDSYATLSLVCILFTVHAFIVIRFLVLLHKAFSQNFQILDKVHF